MTEQYLQQKSLQGSLRGRRPMPTLKQKHIVRNVFIVLGILAVLAGCGGKADQAAATTTATVTASPTPTPTPGLTVRQVASKVASLRATNQKLVKDFDDFCDISKWTDALVDAQATTCSLVVQRAPFEAQFAVKTLTIAHPPAEVAALLVATRTSASVLGKVSTKECTKAPLSDGCTVERFLATQAAENFQLAFAGWEPYI
jgi:hypothetical protein